MVKLVPLQQDDTEVFLEHSIPEYDEKLRSMNVDSVGLRVFEDNIAAQELYKKAGFQITGIPMKKK